MCNRVIVRLITGLALAAFTPWLSAAEDAAHGGTPPDTPAAAEESHAATHGTPAGEGHGEHGATDINPLSLDKIKIPAHGKSLKEDLAVWTGAVFLLLLLVLWKFAWGPIMAGLDKRERTIADEIASAENANQEARKLLEQYEGRLARAEDDVRKLLDEAKRDAQKVGHEIVDKAREEAQAEHRRALAEIELATAGALKELAERSATLAVNLAGKIVEGRLDPAAHARLIQEAVVRFQEVEN